MLREGSDSMAYLYEIPPPHSQGRGSILLASLLDVIHVQSEKKGGNSALSNCHLLLPLFIFANIAHIGSNSTLAGTDSKQHHFQEDIRPNFCQGIMRSRIILVPRSWCHWLHGPVPIQPISLLWLTQREMGAHWEEPGWLGDNTPTV